MCIIGNISLNPLNKLRKLNRLIPVVSTEDRSTSPDLKRKQHNRFLKWTQFRKWTAGLGDLKAIHELTDGEVLSITPSILHLLRSPRVLVPNMHSCWLGSWLLHHKVGVKTIWVLKDWSQSLFFKRRACLLRKIPYDSLSIDSKTLAEFWRRLC